MPHMNKRWADGTERGRCVVCHSRKIRACGSLGESEFLNGRDHNVCDNCGARYNNSNGWIWVMRPRRSKPHVGQWAREEERQKSLESYRAVKAFGG